MQGPRNLFGIKAVDLFASVAGDLIHLSFLICKVGLKHYLHHKIIGSINRKADHHVIGT